METLPDRVPGDSYEPDSGMTSSYVERFTYSRGPAGQEFVYYRAVGAGHWWPNPTQSFSGLWATFLTVAFVRSWSRSLVAGRRWTSRPG